MGVSSTSSGMRCFCGCPAVLFGGWGYRKQENVLNTNAYISLDTQFMGEDAIVLKCGTRLCGTGGVLLNVPLIQDKSYFEVKIQQHNGGCQWGVGVGTRDADLSHPPLGRDYFSWVLRSTGELYHDDKRVSTVSMPPSPLPSNSSSPYTRNGARSQRRHSACSAAAVMAAGNSCRKEMDGSEDERLNGSSVEFEDGDVLGVSYDHVSLQFYLRGVKLENAAFYNIKGGAGQLFPLLYVADDAILDIRVFDFEYKPPKGFNNIMREKSIL